MTSCRMTSSQWTKENSIDQERILLYVYGGLINYISWFYFIVILFSLEYIFTEVAYFLFNILFAVLY